MKRYKLFLAGTIVLPWLSLPFLGIKTIRKFFVSSLIINLFVIAECFLARKQRWWFFYRRLHPKLLGEIPIVLGPFFIGSLWIFKFTYGNFLKYMIVNFILDSFFVYFLMEVFKRIGYGSLIRLKKSHFLSIFTAKAIGLYMIQKIMDRRTENNSVRK